MMKVKRWIGLSRALYFLIHHIGELSLLTIRTEFLLRNMHWTDSFACTWLD